MDDNGWFGGTSIFQKPFMKKTINDGQSAMISTLSAVISGWPVGDGT